MRIVDVLGKIFLANSAKEKLQVYQSSVEELPILEDIFESTFDETKIYKVPEITEYGEGCIEDLWPEVRSMLDALATGSVPLEEVRSMVEYFNEEDANVILCILRKDLQVGLKFDYSEENFPIGTHFRIRHQSDIFITIRPFTNTKNILHYRNTSTGLAGITIEEFCTKL